MVSDHQAPIYYPEKRTKTRIFTKNKARAPLKRSRLSTELETLRAVSKRTFSSSNRMAVRTLLGAIFNQVSVWEAEDRLEEGLYRLLDFFEGSCALKDRGSVCCGDLLHRAARRRQTPKQVGTSVKVCSSE
jgi:hypothetical protein